MLTISLPPGDAASPQTGLLLDGPSRHPGTAVLKDREQRLTLNLRGKPPGPGSLCQEVENSVSFELETTEVNGPQAT